MKNLILILLLLGCVFNASAQVPGLERHTIKATAGQVIPYGTSGAYVGPLENGAVRVDPAGKMSYYYSDTWRDVANQAALIDTAAALRAAIGSGGGGGGVAGSGTTGSIPLFTGSTTLGNSAITENASYVTSTKGIVVQYLIARGANWFLNSEGDAQSLIRSNTTSTNIYRGFTVGQDPDEKDASAIMQINSTTRGVVLTPMTQTQRDAIASPREGLEIWNLTSHKKNWWNGTEWRQSTDSAAP